MSSVMPLRICFIIYILNTKQQFGFSDRWIFRPVCVEACYYSLLEDLFNFQLRARYSNSLIFSSFPAIFFSCFISFLPAFFFFLPSFLLFSSYLNESPYSRNYWELGTLDSILISTCWIYFFVSNREISLFSLYTVQIGFTKGMYR